MDMKNVPTQTGEEPKKVRKLDRIEQKIHELERKKKAIQTKENDKKRKERTRRLIQIGAIAIKYLDCPNDIEPQEFEKRIKALTMK